jgi:alpha-N-acetylglucosamine transferase
MLLFLMGIDISGLGIVLLLIVVFYFVIFRLSKKVLRRIYKDASDQKVNLLSRIASFILAPIIVIGSLALFIYVYIEMTSESDEEITSSHYEMMEEDINEDLKLGMTKIEIVKLLGESDTTQSTMLYDMSHDGVEEKYLLELRFENGRLKSFGRQH